MSINNLSVSVKDEVVSKDDLYLDLDFFTCVNSPCDYRHSDSNHVYSVKVDEVDMDSFYAFLDDLYGNNYSVFVIKG